jgi:DNA-binding transcriptional LysR family regulator
MLDVTKLATLREVIERGSFSAAAVALSLTQPAVSRQVSLLETRLGTQLVRRTRQGVLPTEAGRLLAEHAAAVIGRLSLAETEIAALAGAQTGRVRIGMFFTAFALVAPEVEAHAERRYPGLDVSYALVDRRTAFAQLQSAELDLALVFEHPFEPDPPPPGIDVIQLFDDPACVLLPAKHPLAVHDELTLDQLALERWIRPNEGSAARLLDHVVRPQRVLHAGHGDEPVEMQVYVAAGSGIALAHELNVIVNPAGIAVRRLADAPHRTIAAAVASEQHAPAPRALLHLLTELSETRSAPVPGRAGSSGAPAAGPGG